MDKNIVGYVSQYCNDSFDKRPFCKEDALVLCQFSYLKFDELLPETNGIPMSLSKMVASEKFDTLFSDFRYEKDNRDLFDAVYFSRRFCLMEVCFYINRIETKQETQFSAITFLLPDTVPVVIFRGTDENIVGWQEDFRLSLARPIEGQKLSVEYICNVHDYFNEQLMLGGHSKGGNLALYSMMNCPNKISDSIKTVFSFDAPGFRPEVLKEYDYDSIKDKIVSVIPRSSVVGMLLSGAEDSLVVEAKTFGVSQHNPYNWVIEEKTMVETELSDKHKVLLKSVNQWLLSLDENTLERLVALCEEALEDTGADSTLDFYKEKLKYFSTVVKNSKEFDDNTKKFVQKIIKSFMEIAYENVKYELGINKSKKAGK